MNIDEDYDSSDASDEDYVPSGGENLSEEELSGDDEDPAFLDTLQKSTEETSLKGKKRKSKPTNFSRKRKGGIKLDEDDTNQSSTVDDSYNVELAEQVKKEQEVKKEQDEKKKADSLWADFMKDVESPKIKPKPSGLSGLSSVVQSSSKKLTATRSSCTKAKTDSTEAKPSKVTITKEYDFAGETIKVTKEVDANSKEAKQEQKTVVESEKKPAAGPSIPGAKKVGGLGSVLGKIGNKPKISTLEKSKLDWQEFKKKEGIEEELQIHNRGKQGYIERKSFLERTDMRQFELERDMRLKNSKGGMFLSS